MKAWIRSSVSMVMRLPSRRRATSLPSFTARRPKVDSAMPAWQQKSAMVARIWSFFIEFVAAFLRQILWQACGSQTAMSGQRCVLPTP
ncbi:MAG: hypothetical protein ABW151_18985 [Pseudorhodoplanes sp.]